MAVLVRWRTVLVLALLLLLLIVYARTHRLADTIRRAYEASGKTVIDLPAAVPQSWQRVCILGPYSSQKDADAMLGFSWKVDAHSDIARSDGVVLLVFTKGTDVVAATDYDRTLLPYAAHCYLRADARFTLARPVL